MNEELKDIMEYDEAHYFGINNEIVLGGVITEMTESSNPTESEKQYIHQKSKITKITGFANEFPITMDMVKGDKVFEYMYNLFYERKVGSDLHSKSMGACCRPRKYIQSKKNSTNLFNNRMQWCSRRTKTNNRFIKRWRFCLWYI